MPKADTLTEQDLRNWNLVDSFHAAVDQVIKRRSQHRTFAHPNRRLDARSYLSLFLFGLFNPVVSTMRGLCAASKLDRVQQEVCGRKVSLGSFSETQAVLDSQLLREVFQDLAERIRTQGQCDPRLAHLELIAQDGSLWRALPRMSWAEYGVGSKGEAKGVRLHLRFNLVDEKPVDAQVRRGKSCERRALKEMCQPGQTNVGDRYYGEGYDLFKAIDQAGGFFVFRIKEQAVIHQETEIALNEQDRAAGVVRHAWVLLGANLSNRSMRLRLVEIRKAGQHLLLVTNLPEQDNPASLVGAIYRRRWGIELFFRWVKCILGCRHWFAESANGAAIQIYLALIAALLFQDCTGRRPTKRIMELFRFYLMGWASLEELISQLEARLQAQDSGKKS